MAGLGEAAGIAGLISLAGQTMQSVMTFARFCKDVSTANRDIYATYVELQLFTEVLRYIQENASTTIATDKCLPHLLALIRQHIKRCGDDIDLWNIWIANFCANGSCSVIKGFKKIKAAAEKSEFASIREKLSHHTQKLMLYFQLLERDFDAKLLSWCTRQDAVRAEDETKRSLNHAEVDLKLDKLISSAQDTKIKLDEGGDLLSLKIDGLTRGNTELRTLALQHRDSLETARYDFQRVLQQLRSEVESYRLSNDQRHLGQSQTLHHKITVKPDTALYVLNQPGLEVYLKFRLREDRLRALSKLQQSTSPGYFVSSRSRLSTVSDSLDTIVVAQSPFAERLLMRRFATDVTEIPKSKGVQVLCGLKSKIETLEAAAVTAIHVLRSLAIQGAIAVAKRGFEQDQATLNALSAEDINVDALISAFADTLAKLQAAWIIVDMELLTTAEEQYTFLDGYRQFLGESAH